MFVKIWPAINKVNAADGLQVASG